MTIEFYPIHSSRRGNGQTLDLINKARLQGKVVSLGAKWLLQFDRFKDFSDNVSQAKSLATDFSNFHLITLISYGICQQIRKVFESTFIPKKVQEAAIGNRLSRIKNILFSSLSFISSGSFVLLFAHNKNFISIRTLKDPLSRVSCSTYFSTNCDKVARKTGKVAREKKRRWLENSLDLACAAKTALFSAAAVFRFKIPSIPGLVVNTASSCYLLGKAIRKQKSDSGNRRNILAECRSLGLK